MRLLIVSFLICISTLTSHAQQKEFGWLLGTWKIKDKNIYEVWTYSKELSILNGISFRISNVDTVMLEKIQIKYVSNNFYYIPDVAGDQGPIPFKIVTLGKKNFIAENPDHDFPKTIHYKLVEREHSISIEAIIAGDGKSIVYTFEKIL